MPHGEAMPVGDIVPELVLIVGAVVVLLFALFAPRRAQPFAAGLALITLAVAAATTIPMLRGSQRVTFFDTYAADDVAVWSKLVILGIVAVTVMLSIEWFAGDPRGGEYHSLLLMSGLGAITMAAAADLMMLLVAVLLSSATGYVLAAYHRASPRSAEAGIKYYLLGALTNGGMTYGAVLLLGLAGTTTFAGLREALPGADAYALGVAVSLVAVGLAFKLGAVPAHAWVPDVADGSPAPISGFLTVAPKVGAAVALARVAATLPAEAVGWRPLVALLAAATMTLGNLAALWQDDVRRLLGWSAVSQSGYALMAIVALGRSDLDLAALLFFLAAYALGNLAAFGVVTELRGLADRGAYAGLARTRPWMAASLAVAFLSFIGIPPLAGFAGKLALFGAAIDAGYAWLAVLAVANTVVSIAYYGRVLAPMYFEPAASAEPAPALGRWAGVATITATAGVVALGVGAEGLLDGLMSSRLLP